MIAAARILASAHNLGVRVEIDGPDLVLRAPREPPRAVVDELVRHKAELMALLRRGGDGWEAGDWRALFDERAAIAEFDGGLTRADAEAAALAHCAGAWLLKQVKAPAGGGCAGCGEGDTGGGRIIPAGRDFAGAHSWFHPACWTAWRADRMPGALAALSGLGVPPLGLGLHNGSSGEAMDRG